MTTLYNLIDLYALISSSNIHRESRKEGIEVRKQAIASICSGGLIKLAFDTRRIKQDTDFNPRRNLQNYHRSEALISEAQIVKKNNFTKLYNVCGELKAKYEQESEWQDSYCRVLYNTLHNALRVDQGDEDYSDTGTTIGSWDYVEEMIFARYRLDMNNIEKYGAEQLKEALLSKDPELMNKSSVAPLKITKSDIAEKPYDALMEKLFGNVKASASSPKVKRTVTITVEDSIEDEIAPFRK